MYDNMEWKDGVLLSYRGAEKLLVVPEGTHTIGENACKGLRNLEQVILPDTVRCIEKHAFKGCKMLREINFPDYLERIGDYAFHRCHSLRAAILPESLESLGLCAFLYCDSLEKVSVMGVKKLAKHTFTNDINLREIALHRDLDRSNLGDDIFTGCMKIRKITLSDGEVFEMDNLISVFNDRQNADPLVLAVAEAVYHSMQLENGRLYRFSVDLKVLALPEGITCIERGCFYDKRGIVSIILPHSLERVKANAFGNCISLEEVTVLNENLVLEEGAFKACNNLSRIHLWDGSSYDLEESAFDENAPLLVRRISEQVRSDFYISGKILMEYRGREMRVRIPRGIRVIGESCFQGNETIERIVLPDSIEEIREYAFKNCVSIQTITLPAGLRLIEKGAFENCRKLLRVSFPEGVIRLGESAFKRCAALHTFEVCQSLEEIGDMAFYGCQALKKLELPSRTRVAGKLTFFQSGLETDGNAGKRNRQRFSGCCTGKEQYAGGDILPYQFCGDETITDLKITDVCRIGKYSFSACRNLKSLEIDNPDCILEEFAFANCDNLIELKLRVKRIGKSAFAFCRKLERISIDLAAHSRVDDTNTADADSMTDVLYSVSEEAFLGCGNLHTVMLSGQINELGRRCFEECVSLQDFPLENIIRIGERAFARCEGLERLILPEAEIGPYAFADCCHMKSITLSERTVLKSRAFFGCTEIREICWEGQRYHFDRFDQSVNCLSNPYPERVQEVIGSICSCFKVSEKQELLSYLGDACSVTVPEDIIALGDETFRNHLRLTEIRIPPSVSYVGKLTFAGTGWLEKVRQEYSMTIVNRLLLDASDCGERAEIPEDVERICSWSFAGNCGLQELKFLGQHTVIDEYAFRNCINLKRIVTADGQVYLLEGIDVREDKKLPEWIRSIFLECINCFKTDQKGNLIESTGNIKNLVLPFGIRSIGKAVYQDCNLLESIVLSEDTESIGEHAFENSKWLREVKNAVGVRKIGSFAFSGCQSLEEIELSDHLTEIGKRSFEHCCRLREILIPEGVEEIPERAFFRCKSLKSIRFPSTLKVIGREAFAFCESLEEIYYPEGISTEEIQIGDRAFAWCPKWNFCCIRQEGS